MHPTPSHPTADVVVIGGGVVGASVAWHLASRGCRDVVVVERGATIGEGSTGRATGGFRAQFATPINVRLSLLARAKLLRFQEETGVDPGYEPHGYLFLAMSEVARGSLREALAVQHAAGLTESAELEPAAIPEINSFIAPEGIVGAAFCPTDGFIQPMQILRGYLEGAERQGTRVHLGETCRAILTEPEDGIVRVAGVETEHRRIATRQVVNAAGPWAADLARLAGASLPVRPLRRQIAVTQPCAVLPASMPMTVFADDGFHLRVRDGRVNLLWPRPSAGDDLFDTRFDPEWLEGLLELACERVPGLGATSIDVPACRAGLYEMSPDHHAILGESPEVAGLYFANGSSGHGVMHAPALGQLLAEIILEGEATTLDTRPLRPSRFEEGDPNPVSGTL